VQYDQAALIIAIAYDIARNRKVESQTGEIQSKITGGPAPWQPFGLNETGGQLS
jgi:hypothetical protein